MGVGVNLGNGDGTFQSSIFSLSSVSLETTGSAVVVGDFNGDGIPDIAELLPQGVARAGTYTLEHLRKNAPQSDSPSTPKTEAKIKYLTFRSRGFRCARRADDASRALLLAGQLVHGTVRVSDHSAGDRTPVESCGSAPN